MVVSCLVYLPSQVSLHFLFHRLMQLLQRVFLEQLVVEYLARSPPNHQSCICLAFLFLLRLFLVLPFCP